MTHTQSHQEEPLFEQGRRLARQREDLIAQGVDPSELLIPLAPAEPTDTPDLLASFRAYVRAAEVAVGARMTWHLERSPTSAEAAIAAYSAERTAREAHETALRAVGER